MLLLLVLLANATSTTLTNRVSKSWHINNPKNCRDIQNNGINITGVYSIKPDVMKKPFFVYCDMEIRGGGWLYFLNRMDGSEDFSVQWKDYKNGFGNLAGEFWLGLEHIYQLTETDVNELLVELVDWNLKKYHIHYKIFSISNEEQDYRLSILGGYSGDLKDSLMYHGGNKFSTIDRDNDKHSNSCAKLHGGGWWYKFCYNAHLTGVYYATVHDDTKGITWKAYKQVDPNFSFYTFKEARMMIRPQSGLLNKI